MNKPLLPAMTRGASANRTGDRLLSATLLAILTVLIVYPMVMLVLGAIRPGPGLEGGVSSSGLYKVFTSPQFYVAWYNTILVSLVASVASVALGVLLAFLIERTDLPWRGAFKTFVIMPLFVAPFIGAIAWTGVAAPRVGILNQFLTLIGMPFNVDIYSIPGIIVVLALYKVPYVYMFTAGPLRSLDASLEEASRLAGRNMIQTLMRVTLPMVFPSILAVFLLCFVLSLENFGVLAVLGLPSQIPFVSTELFVRLTYYPPDYAYATIVAVSLIVVTTFGLWLQTRVLRSGDYVAISGRGYRASRIPLKSARPWAFAFVLLFVFISVILPFGVLLLASLQPYWTVGFPGLTLDNYTLMFGRQALSKAVTNSITAAGVGALVTTVLAVAVAYLVQRTRAPARGTIDFLAMLPISIPGAALGVALLWAWIVVPLPIFGTLLIIILAFVTKFLPLGVRNVSAALTQVGPDLEAAARLSGATRFKAVTSVTLPLVRDSIFASWVLLFVSMIKEVNTSILLYSFSTTLVPILIFDAREDGNFPRVAALAVGLTVVLLVLIGITQKVFNSRLDPVDRT